MSPDPFDEIDRALASGLSRLAPETHDADAALAAARPRFRRARTRARVAKIGGAIVGVLAIGSVATLAAPHSGRTHVSVSGSSTSVSTPTSSTVRPTTTSVPAPTPVTRPGAITNPSTTPGSSAPNGKGSGTTPGTVPSTTPGSVPEPGGTEPSGGGGGSRGPGGSPGTPTTTANTVQVFNTTGGSIAVRLSNGTVLGLVSATPASGYTDDVRDSGPDRVEVRFSSGEEVKSQIDVQIENGQMVRTDHSGR